MENVIALINDPNVNLLGAVFKLLLSLMLGAVVGLERRHKGQIAGMRTFALISMGATLAMLVSIYIPQEYMGLKNGDPGRIAAQVISGIGFLGAGAIIQMKGSVKGLTTAAGIWAMAAIGLAVGAGMYVISITACVLILLVLTLAEKLEHKLLKMNESKIVRVKTRGIVKDLTPYHQILERYHVLLVDEFIRHDYANSHSVINFIILSKGKLDFMSLFREMHDITETSSITMSNEVNN